MGLLLSRTIYQSLDIRVVKSDYREIKSSFSFGAFREPLLTWLTYSELSFLLYEPPWNFGSFIKYSFLAVVALDRTGEGMYIEFIVYIEFGQNLWPLPVS